MIAARVMTPFLLLAALVPAFGESLWSPGFKGYLSGGRGLAVGDALVVQIDASSSLSFSASSNDSKTLTMEFSGGEAGNLFSFLPQVRTGGNLTAAGKDTLSLKTEVPVVVTVVNADGTAQVQGSRSIAVQGKNESVTISGAVSPALLDQKGSIAFNRLANARLVYTTFLVSSQEVLSNADLQQMLVPAAAGAKAAAAQGGQPTAGAQPAQGATGAAAGTAQPPATQLAIPDARKKQLLLQYLNRLIDVYSLNRT